MHALMMKRTALQFHENSFLVPAQQIAEQRAAEKAAKQVKIPKKQAMVLTNPATTSGLCVTENVLKQMQEVEAASKAKKEEELTKKEANKEKQVLTDIESKKLAKEVFETYQTGRNSSKNADAWKKLNVAHMKAAYKWYVPKGAKASKMPTKKDDFVGYLCLAFAGLASTGANFVEADDDNHNDDDREDVPETQMRHGNDEDRDSDDD